MARRKSNLVPVREPNGRLLRSVESAIGAMDPANVRRLRDAACARMAAPEWGSELGRLYLAGKLGPKLFETGKRWARLAAEYQAAVGAPLPAPPSAAFFQSGHKRTADPDTEAGKRDAERDRAVVDAAREGLAILLSAGREKLSTVRAVCERDESPVGERGMADLMIGLGYIAQHWGIIDLGRIAR